MASESKWNSKFNPKLQSSTKNWSDNCIPGTDNGIIDIQSIQDMANDGNVALTSVVDGRKTTFPNLSHTSGIMSITLHDTLGPNNNEETSPMNMAWIEHKAYMDTALGQQFGYSAADLGQVVGGFKTIVDLHRYIRRILNLVNNPKTPLSNYSIAGLLKSMHLSTEDTYDPDPLKVQRELSRKRRNYIDDMNGVLDLFDEVGIPKKLSSLLDVSADYYDKVYLDATSENAQFYIFNPAGWYEYDETSDPAGAVLTYKTFYNDLNTPKASSDPSKPNYSPFAGNHTCSVQDLIDKFAELVMNLTHLTDSKEILHKLFNAYGSDNLYDIPEIGESEKVPYVYDAGFRNTIRNMVWFKDLTYAQYKVDPNREIVMGRPTWDAKASTSQYDFVNIINLPLQFSDSPSKITDKNIADALVLHPTLGFTRRWQDADNNWHLTYDFGNQMGFAIPIEVALIGYAWDSNGVLQNFSEYKLVSRDSSLALGMFQDWAFFPPVLNAKRTSSDSTMANIVVQLDRYYTERETEVTISKNDIKYWFRAFGLGVYNTVERMNTKGQRQIVG